ncbi:Uroporphyrinogen-III methyltransferase [hydrothermal vent metagenome]|uniref:uroporphyrinogen-III C-methyltransferase n=1 Tax=hydrothermal vent metagenome TaxID=652676 RepID=A0A3B1B7P3_9ZZZZ
MNIDDVFENLPDMIPGSVWLAGAGPGDPGLLSLLTLKALRQADVVVYDALVNQEILKMTGQKAVLEFAGKRGGQPSEKQADISERLVALAKAGNKVLRLKGGDPFVFGRGGEEARCLVKSNIPFRVVPGITAGIGGLAYAGIPLTDRHTNSAVTFLTGHGEDGGLAKDIDWDSLAKSSPVIVIYMALSRIELMCEQFLKSGRRPDEAVAIISKGTTTDQTVLETTLSQAAEEAARAKIKAPALIVLGENVKLRAGLDWLGAMEGKVLNADVSAIKPQGKNGLR